MENSSDTAVKVYETTNREDIVRIFTELHQEVSSDDYPVPDEKDFNYMLATGLFFAVEANGEVGGIFYLHKVRRRVWQGHIQMLPKFRGAIADAALELAVKLLTRIKKVDSIVTEVPAWFKNVVNFLERHSFKCVGTLPKMCVKNEKKYPIFVFEREIKK